MVDVRITLTGPVFDGRAERQVGLMLEDLTEVVAAQALADVQQILDRDIVNPTPYYETQIVMERAGSDRVVHDRGIVYGPWLEGVSSRNALTGFGGYRSFRRATQAVEKRIDTLTKPVVARHIERMI